MEEKLLVPDEFFYIEGEGNFKKAEYCHKNEQYQDAVKFYKKSYDKFQKAYFLHIISAKHQGIDFSVPEIEHIRERIRELCEKEVAEAFLLRTKIEPMSKFEKLKLCEQAAKINYAEAVFKLARTYFDGKSRERDVEKCKELLQKAVDLGHSGAVYYLDLLNKNFFGEADSYEAFLQHQEYSYEEYST